MMTDILDEKINIKTLTRDEYIQHTKKVYTEKSYFQTLFHQDSVEFSSHEHTENLRAEVSRILISKQVIKTPVVLEELHHHIPQELKDYNMDDGVNKISSFLYETDDSFQQVYLNFIKDIRKNYIKEEFWFQLTPTIRLHCPNAKNSNHYPRYHTDLSSGHPPEEINLWLPLTNLLGGHGFKVMSIEDSIQSLKKFNYDHEEFVNNQYDKVFSSACDNLAQDVTTERNFVLAFDSRCVHSGLAMKDHTRVSMDIRVLPLSQYKKMQFRYQGAGRRKIIFAPGYCYHHLSSDQIS